MLDGTKAFYGGSAFPLDGGVCSRSCTAGAPDLPEAGGITDDILRVNVFADFKLFLMYRPDGPDNIWVPLREVDWGWTASAEHAAGTSWTSEALVAQPLRGPTIIDAYPSRATFPEWQGKLP
jgi:hypothetical protein